MNGAFYIGATGLNAQQQALDVVANNIANVNTTGFKRSATAFRTLVSPIDPQARTSQAQQNSAASLGGVVVGATPLVMAEGSLQQTGQPLDVAIQGDGFFELMGPSGQTLLWRGGSMQVNQDGYLAASNGMALKALISVPADASSISISAAGKVQAVVGNDATPTSIGQIDLVRVKDPTALSAQSGGLYQVQDRSDLIQGAPGADGMGTFASGSLEGSNVDLTTEMTNMILLQRAYGANAEAVQAGDQLMSIANGLIK